MTESNNPPSLRLVLWVCFFALLFGASYALAAEAPAPVNLHPTFVGGNEPHDSHQGSQGRGTDDCDLGHAGASGKPAPA